MQHLSPNGLPDERDPTAWAEAVEFVNFAMELAETQRRGNRSFVFEHPWQASSWKLESVVSMWAKSDVKEVLFDMCCFGMEARDADGVVPVRKTTRVLSNDEGILNMLDRRREEGHRHVVLVSGRPKSAAVYPERLCEALVAGYDVTRRGLSLWSVLNASAGEYVESADLCDPEDNYRKADAGSYWND